MEFSIDRLVVVLVGSRVISGLSSWEARQRWKSDGERNAIPGFVRFANSNSPTMLCFCFDLSAFEVAMLVVGGRWEGREKQSKKISTSFISKSHRFYRPICLCSLPPFSPEDLQDHASLSRMVRFSNSKSPTERRLDGGQAR